MSVIKSAPVNGSQSSFIPGLEKQTDIENTSVADVSQDSIRPEKAVFHNLSQEERISLGKSYLASLSKHDQKELLLQSFDKELQQIKDQSIQDGKEQGLEEAKVLAEQQYELHIEGVKSELKQVMIQWLDIVQQTEQQASWVIDEPENLLLLITRALSKLLPINLLQPQYVDELVTDLITKYGKYSPKTLFLPQVQFEQYMEVMNDKVQAFDIKPDSNLAIGSYRLALQFGDIHYHLQQIFEQFVSDLQSQMETSLNAEIQGSTEQ